MKAWKPLSEIRRCQTINPFVDPQFERKPSGAFIVDGMEVAHTIQCCHCGMHFLSIRGSGKLRGFCMRCARITCGKKDCDPCVPFEKKVEMLEKGKIKWLF